MKSFSNITFNFVGILHLLVDSIQAHKGCLSLLFSSNIFCNLSFFSYIWLHRSYSVSEMKRKACFPFAFHSTFRIFAKYP